MPVCLFNELFIANLAVDTTEDEVKALFIPYGIVVDCWVGQKKLGEGNGNVSFASVRMDSNAEAFSAKKSLNGLIFKDRKLVVKWAANQRLLWIGGLPESVTEQVLKDVFSRFGCLERAVVVPGAREQVASRHAFVLFKDKKAAQKAMEKAEGGDPPFDGARVEWARVESHAVSSPDGPSARPAGPKVQLTPGFVCICTHKSVQLDSTSHFTRDTHDQQLHDEMQVDMYKHQGANVQTMYLPGGGLMAVNPSKKLVIGARAHRMAVFMGQLTNYDELVEKYGIVQPAPSESGKKRSYNVPELLCILYSKMGLSMLSELQGKFAFCMYDPRLVRVLAVRDPSGTYPVVQAYTVHKHLIIVCGPYFPDGHHEEIMLEPCQYKYGWHAPPLYYEGNPHLPAVMEEPTSEIATSEEGSVKKKRTRRGRKGKKRAVVAEADDQSPVELADTAEAAEEDEEEEDASIEAGDMIAHEAETGDVATRRRRRRRRSRRKAGASAAANEEVANLLPEDLDECGGLHPSSQSEASVHAVDDPANDAVDLEDTVEEQNGATEGKAGKRRRRRRSKSSTQRSELDVQPDTDSSRSALDQAGSSSSSPPPGKTSVSRRISIDQPRENGGSRRVSMERPRSNGNCWAFPERERDLSGSWRSSPDRWTSWQAASDQHKDGGKWKSSAEKHASSGSWRSSTDMQKDNAGRKISMDGQRDTGSWRASVCLKQTQQHAVKESSDSQSRGLDQQQSVYATAANIVAANSTWETRSSSNAPVTDSPIAKLQPLAESVQTFERIEVPAVQPLRRSLLLSSHRISVGHDLDSLGTMLAAGLAGASSGGQVAMQNAFAKAVAAMKPSRSCGELTALHNASNQGPAWVW